MSEKIVVGIGEALWDMLPDGKKIGGAPANFAYHISRLGLPSCAVSAVGRDVLGHELLEQFREKQISFIMPEVNFPTGTVEVSLDANGIPSYDISRNAAWDNIPFTNEIEALAQRTCAVAFGSLAQRDPVSRHTIERFLDSMPHDEATLRVFDINLRQSFYTKEIIEESMRRCNIMKINDEELTVVGRLFDIPTAVPSLACRALLNRYGLKALVLTCGVNGSFVFTPDGGESFMPTPAVDVVDTVGAGDSFTATFIASLLKGRSIAEAHKLAVDVSAYVCSRAGAMPKLPADLMAD